MGGQGGLGVSLAVAGRRFGGWRDKRREKKRGSGVDVGDAASGAVNIGFEMPDDLVAALLVRTRKRHVIGWRAALRTRDALAEHLRTGAPMDSVIQPG